AVYRGKKTSEILFPLGGIGTGSVGLSGNGALKDWEIFNRPNKGSYNAYSFLSVRAEEGDTVLSAKVLQGDAQKGFMGSPRGMEYIGFGFGIDRDSMEGMPHFSRHSFESAFPFATLRYTDDTFPGKVSECAFNPFIPTDSLHSSLPCAIFEVTFENNQERPLSYTAAFSLTNPYGADSSNRDESGKRKTVTLSASKAKKGTPAYGDMTLSTDAADGFVQPYWYRGEWMDAVTTFWNEFSSKKDLPYRTYSAAGINDVATVGGRVTLAPGETGKVRFVMTWNNPIAEKYWNKGNDLKEGDNPITFRNFYGTVFRNSLMSNNYVFRKMGYLRRHSEAFRKVFFGSSEDKAVLDAASASLCVLKSPTVLRLEDGSFWAWEGVHEKAGSCEGTCTHVWSYAYAMCFLFPDLERGLRKTEYTVNMNSRGAVRFRTPIPPLPVSDEEKIVPCLDGQMAGVMKTYREWKLSGDNAWLKEIYPLCKKSLEYAWDPDSAFRWDKDKDGVLEGRQHHTLDMELFGPSAWLEGMYIGALTAASEMAKALGETQDAETYLSLAEKGKTFTEKELFNGKYYTQKTDLNDRTLIVPYGDEAVGKYWNEEAGEIKYQVGEGSEIDQCLGEWHASLCGLPPVFDERHCRSALQFLYENNYRKNLRLHVNAWRVFAANDEAGAMICHFPKDARRPIIPVPYADECMHGFEYALAGLMAAKGMRQEAVDMVRSFRERYDGEKRNPFNEIECGSHFARSMAAYGLLPILAGFTFDMPQKRIGFNPGFLRQKSFYQTVFGAGNAFGVFRMGKNAGSLRITEGRLTLRKADMPDGVFLKTLTADGKALAFTQDGRTVSFAEIAFRTLRFTF
ncbi:MAG: non-lysosomal glucosylceramidase, partial [Clostridia bacterium]|nr:non-lysosomal glucosylceramidase [Clostridia bacterium]